MILHIQSFDASTRGCGGALGEGGGDRLGPRANESRAGDPFCESGLKCVLNHHEHGVSAGWAYRGLMRPWDAQNGISSAFWRRSKVSTGPPFSRAAGRKACIKSPTLISQHRPRRIDACWSRKLRKTCFSGCVDDSGPPVRIKKIHFALHCYQQDLLSSTSQSLASREHGAGMHLVTWSAYAAGCDRDVGIARLN